MSRVAFPASGLLGLATALAVPSGAAAQCRLCTVPITAIETPSTPPASLEVETNLSFDRVLLVSSDGGTATLRPDGSRSVSGGLVELSGKAMVGTAIVRGEPGRAIRIELPKRIALHSLDGDSVSIEEVTSDLPDMARLDSTGRLTFRFGGQLKVTGDADGDYRGELPIFVDYL